MFTMKRHLMNIRKKYIFKNFKMSKITVSSAFFSEKHKE